MSPKKHCPQCRGVAKPERLPFERSSVVVLPHLLNKWVVVDGQRYRVKLTAREMRTLDKKGISLHSM